MRLENRPTWLEETEIPRESADNPDSTFSEFFFRGTAKTTAGGALSIAIKTVRIRRRLPNGDVSTIVDDEAENETLKPCSSHHIPALLRWVLESKYGSEAELDPGELNWVKLLDAVRQDPNWVKRLGGVDDLCDLLPKRSKRIPVAEFDQVDIAVVFGRETLRGLDVLNMLSKGSVLDRLPLSTRRACRSIANVHVKFRHDSEYFEVLVGKTASLLVHTNISAEVARLLSRDGYITMVLDEVGRSTEVAPRLSSLRDVAINLTMISKSIDAQFSDYCTESTVELEEILGPLQRVRNEIDRWMRSPVESDGLADPAASKHVKKELKEARRDLERSLEKLESVVGECRHVLEELTSVERIPTSE